METSLKTGDASAITITESAPTATIPLARVETKSEPDYSTPPSFLPPPGGELIALPQRGRDGWGRNNVE